MKLKSLLKSTLLLCALIAGSTSAWADTYTIGWGTASGEEGTYKNFTATFGTVTDIVSFSSAQNNGTTAPTYNSNNNDLRLYYHSGGNGGSITLTPSAGVTITGAVMTTSTSPSVNYSVDGGTATSVSASSNTYTVTGISATSSLTFQNVNTLNTQLRIKTIQITYTKVDIPKHTATFNVNGGISSKDFKEGENIAFPEVSNILGMKFMGWTTNEIVGTQASAPSPLLSNATMSTSDITYYAVFAYSDPGKYVLDYNAEPDLSSSSLGYGAALIYTARDGSEWAIKAYKSSGMQINTGKNSSIKIPDCPFSIKSIDITCSAAKAVGFSSSDYTGSGTISYIVSGSDATSQTLNFTGESVKSGYIVPKSGSTSITKIEVTYSNTAILKDYCTTIPSSTTVTLALECSDGAFYYGTYSNARAFVVPSDLIISEISIVDGKLILTDYDTDDVVPGNTGVLISSDVAGEHTLYYSGEKGTSKLGGGNYLITSGDAGIDAASMAAAAPGCKYYRLTMHNGSQFGFWWGAAEGAAFAVDANKAYLAVPNITPAREGFTFGEDVTTGISEECRVKSEEFATAVMYDLQGRRVEKATKGLYIRNGREVFVK